jgi:hypothetical protein
MKFKDKPAKKIDVGPMLSRVYRLRILQDRLANPATLNGYKREEDVLLARLQKLGVKEEQIQEAIDVFSGKKK